MHAVRMPNAKWLAILQCVIVSLDSLEIPSDIVRKFDKIIQLRLQLHAHQVLAEQMLFVENKMALVLALV